MPLHQCQVTATHLPRLDLRRKPAMGLAGARDDHQPGGVLIESVDDPGAPRRAAAEQVAQRVDECGPALPRRGVDDEPGGLVDHRQPRVGVDHAGLTDQADPRPGARPRSAAGAIETRIRAIAPRVIATSARLKAGHSGGSMKTVTASSRILSARLPSAPPASKPTPSQRPGRPGSLANQARTSVSAAIVTARTNP